MGRPWTLSGEAMRTLRARPENAAALRRGFGWLDPLRDAPRLAITLRDVDRDKLRMLVLGTSMDIVCDRPPERFAVAGDADVGVLELRGPGKLYMDGRLLGTIPGHHTFRNVRRLAERAARRRAKVAGRRARWS